MACSVTAASSSSSSSSRPSTTLDAAAAAAAPLPTISLDAAAGDVRQDADRADDDPPTIRLPPTVAAADNVADVAAAETRRVSRAGHDRKKHASYRYGAVCDKSTENQTQGRGLGPRSHKPSPVIQYIWICGVFGPRKLFLIYDVHTDEVRLLSGA